jgi:hypothetical protein
MVMTDKKHLSDLELDALFETAASSTVEPSANLIARVMADADAVAGEREFVTHLNAETAPLGRLAAFLRGIGGWPAVAGMSAATVAGVWIGYAPPDALNGISDAYLAGVTGFGIEDFVPSYDAMFDEG